MPPKKLYADQYGNIKDPEKSNKSYRSKAYVPGIIEGYIRQRDMWLLNQMFTCEETKQAIREKYKL